MKIIILIIVVLNVFNIYSLKKADKEKYRKMFLENCEKLKVESEIIIKNKKEIYKNNVLVISEAYYPFLFEPYNDLADEFNKKYKQKTAANTALSFTSMTFSLYSIAGLVTASVFIVQNMTGTLKMSPGDYQNIQIALASSSFSSLGFALLFLFIPFIVNYNFRKKILNKFINKYNERLGLNKKKNDLSILFNTTGDDILEIDTINIGLIYKF